MLFTLTPFVILQIIKPKRALMNTMDHYLSSSAPDIFVDGYLSFAISGSPGNGVTGVTHGGFKYLYGRDRVSEQSFNRLKKDCDSFWIQARELIKSLKGRCRWHPLVDTHENHVSMAGYCFYFARSGSHFFMDFWPAQEREAFISLASEFGPMHLAQIDGSLEYIEGRIP